MSYVDLSYAEAIEKAEHIKALGIEEVDISKGPKPWSLATRCEPGGTHRLDIATVVRFYGSDPETGLTFLWSFDIESPEVGRSIGYQIDAAECRRVLRKLPEKVRDSFRRYLLDCAATVAERGEYYRRQADRQMADAETLRAIAAVGDRDRAPAD